MPQKKTRGPSFLDFSVWIGGQAESPKKHRGMFFQDGLTGSAWGDWANYTESPLRAFAPGTFRWVLRGFVCFFFFFWGEKQLRSRTCDSNVSSGSLRVWCVLQLQSTIMCVCEVLP